MSSPVCQICDLKSSAAQHLSEKELEKMNKNCVQVTYKKGETIFKQGSFSTNITYLRTGLVKVHIMGPEKEQIIKIAKAPSYLGIPTTIDEEINRYSATAIMDTSVCYIDIETFKNFIVTNGHFSHELVISLCKEELASYTRCVNRAQKNAAGKIADALLFFKNDIFNSPKFTLPLSREELGNLIDATRESVSRTIAELNNDGFIKVSGKHIEILKEESLKMISQNG